MKLKRLFTAALAALSCLTAVTLCGCAPGATDQRTLPKCFDCTAQIEFDGMVYETAMSRLSDGWWEVELTAPEAVKGLVFSVNGDDTEISFKGLHFTFDTSKFPVGSVVSLAIKSFDRLAPLSLDVVSGETTNFASGEADGMTYSMTLDKNGTPLTLDLGDSGMKITFTSFEERQEEAPAGEVTTAPEATTSAPEVTTLPETSAADDITTSASQSDWKTGTAW